MTTGNELDKALRPGRVRLGDGKVEAEITEVDRLGVSIEHLQVRGEGAGVREIAAKVPDALRALPERILPIEVAPDLGGAILRSDPADMHNREFYEARTDGRVVEIERYRCAENGRERIPFTLTREQLGRVVDGLERAVQKEEP